MAINNSLELGNALERKQVERASRSTTWHGMAFVIESLVLLVFLTASLAVFSLLLSTSHTTGSSTRELTTAVLAAENVAEQFSASPSSVHEETTIGDNVVKTTVTPQSMDGGTLYNATIVVYQQGGEIYRLTTARYVSEVK